ncbi:MAG TPA: GAF domain-containing protein, partial [Polyangiaceae bacterium]|nr:GAF domain-containing protein [Polyangiaceae bacterium]
MPGPQKLSTRDQVLKRLSERLRAAERRAALLSRAGEALSSLEPEGAAERIVQAWVPAFADCSALYVRQEASISLRAISLREGERSRAWPLLLAERKARLDDRSGPGAVMQSGQPELLEGQSQLTLPLPVRGDESAALAFWRADPSRRFDTEDVALGLEFARQAGLALDRARLLGSERSARAVAERVATRIERLQTANNELASALSLDRIAEVTVDHGVAAIGGSAAALFLLRGEQLRLVRSYGYRSEDLEPVGTIALDAHGPLSDAIRSAEPVLIGARAEYVPAGEHRGEQARALFEGGQALACLSLSAAGARFGGLVIAFSAAQSFPRQDRAFLSLLANHCAQALLRTRVLEQERRYHERIRLLADAGPLLTSSLDYEQTLNNVGRLALPALGDFCFLDIVEESGTVRRVASAHEDPETLALLQQTKFVRSKRSDINLCALSSGRTGFHPEIDDAWLRDVASSSEHLAMLRRLHMCSMITVPLPSHGELLGALTLAHGRSGRHHTANDVALAEELGIRAALAVRQTRLYRT